MVKEIEAKSILHYHAQAFATNWDANIYRWCEHNCKYCFAQYSHKYLEDQDFFNDIHVKANAPELLTKELNKQKWEWHQINVCGISDCYQPAEEKYKIMPNVIKAFIASKNPLLITTKSTLILRDIELIKELNKVAEVTIMISVTTLDEKKRKLVEPNTAPTIERMKMLKIFSDLGFKTGVLFMPILPYISDDEKNMDEIFRITKKMGLGSILVYPLHLRGNTKKVFYSFLKESFPDLLVKYEKLYKNSNVSNEYKIKIQNKVNLLRKKYGLFKIYKPSKLKPKQSAQVSLF